MKHLTSLVRFIRLLGLASLALTTVSTAAPLSLEDAMSIAEQRGEVLAAQARARAAEYRATAVSRSGYLPQLELTAFTARSNRESVSEFSIPTPGGPLNQRVVFAEKDKSGFTVAYNQPLVNVANWLYQRPAAKFTEQAAQLQAEHTRRQARVLGAEAYLNVLALAAQQRAVNELVSSLDARVSKLNSLVAAGRVLESEGLRVQLARDSAQQTRLDINAQRELALIELERVLGKTETLMSDGLNSTDLNLPSQWPIISTTDEIWLSAFQQRLDIQAINAQIDSLEASANGVIAEALPTLSGQVSYTQNEGVRTTPDEETQVSLALNWTPFSSGTRVPQQSALAEQRNALLAERDEARLAIRVQLEQARQDYHVAAGLQQLAITAVDSARATLKTRSARFDAGRANVDDVLDAEAELAEQTANASIADYQRLRAWLRWQLAQGMNPQLVVLESTTGQ